MKIQFDSEEEYSYFRQSVHDACLYWTKVRQDAQGKICMQCDGTPTHYSEQYAVDMMIQNGNLLSLIECTPHPEWDEDEKCYKLVSEEYPSHMVEKCNKLMPKTEL